MNREEFNELVSNLETMKMEVKQNEIEEYNRYSFIDNRTYNQILEKINKSKRKNTKKMGEYTDVFHYEVETGGTYGSYDGLPERYVNKSNDVDFIPELEKLCEIIDIKFMDFRKLMKATKKIETTEQGYYGSSTDYKIFYITLDDVFELVKKYDYPHKNELKL